MTQAKQGRGPAIDVNGADPVESLQPRAGHHPARAGANDDKLTAIRLDLLKPLPDMVAGPPPRTLAAPGPGMPQQPARAIHAALAWLN